MGAWLFSVFVMTPFAIIRTALAVFGIYSFTQVPEGIGNLGFGILSLVLLLVVNKIVRLIRFGGGTSMAYNFIDLIVSPLSLPLILAVNMIAFISIFTYIEVDARSEPDMDEGFWAAVVLYLFHVEIDTSDRKAKKAKKSKNSASRGYCAIEGKRAGRDIKYKLKNIAYQFMVFVFTVIHSLPVIIFALNIPGDHSDSAFHVIMMIIVFFVYVCTAFLSAMYKGVTVDHSFYSDTKIEEVTTEQTVIGIGSGIFSPKPKKIIPIGDPVEKKRRTVVDRGWNSYTSFRMILYWIVGSLMFINQFVVLVLAIVIPSKARFCPCRPYDVKRDTIRSKLLYFFFGVADSEK